MKVLGIEIKGNCAIFTAIEDNGELNDITGKMSKLALENDENAEEIHSFVDIIHSHFDNMQFDKIGIIKRAKSFNSKFAVAPVSFKLEGLIQTYKNADIIFVAPQTLRAYYKKNENPFCSKFSYQKPSAELAYYLLEND